MSVKPRFELLVRHVILIPYQQEPGQTCPKSQTLSFRGYDLVSGKIRLAREEVFRFAVTKMVTLGIALAHDCHSPSFST